MSPSAARKPPSATRQGSGYWHTLATLARWCRIRSYLDSAAAHGITALDAIRYDTRRKTLATATARRPLTPIHDIFGEWTPAKYSWSSLARPGCVST